MLPNKKSHLKIPAITFLYRSLWAQIFKKMFQTWKRTTIIPEQIVGQDRPEKQLNQTLIRSGEIPSPRKTSTTKPTTMPWNLNGARSWGAPTHPLVTVFTKRLMIRGGRRPGVWYKHTWALLCRKQATKLLDPSPMAKNRPFSGLGQERRTPRATSRPLRYTTDPHDIFEAVIYIHRPRTGLAVGWFYVEIEGLWSREPLLISVLTISTWERKFPLHFLLVSFDEWSTLSAHYTGYIHQGTEYTAPCRTA